MALSILPSAPVSVAIPVFYPGFEKPQVILDANSQARTCLGVHSMRKLTDKEVEEMLRRGSPTLTQKVKDCWKSCSATVSKVQSCFWETCHQMIQRWLDSDFTLVSDFLEQLKYLGPPLDNEGGTCFDDMHHPDPAYSDWRGCLSYNKQREASIKIAENLLIRERNRANLCPLFEKIETAFQAKTKKWSEVLDNMRLLNGRENGPPIPVVSGGYWLNIKAYENLQKRLLNRQDQ